MTTETHTPGPWKWFNYPDGRKILTATNRAVIHCPDAPIGIDPPDARLIAAAPDLLEALRDADDILANFLTFDDTRWARVRAAIEKAEGR